MDILLVFLNLEGIVDYEILYYLINIYKKLKYF